ncbi:hypothetical protein GCM10007067_04520 [Lysobacter bugurensis]|uniref:Uncharacterized protein n=1 Tax=Cognatilysobacter bugurensis TaxID=543356 RepID=A0A918SUM7_9GAMM|nr:hypothetical protein GCM10007067_04520 [Lysobacter bugurensis]
MAPYVAPQWASWAVAAPESMLLNDAAMLPPPCRWIDCPDGSFLRWNMRTVAYVRPAGRRYQMTIHWRRWTHTGCADSCGQGKRFIEQWIEKQSGHAPSARERLNDEAAGTGAMARGAYPCPQWP